MNNKKIRLYISLIAGIMVLTISGCKNNKKDIAKDKGQENIVTVDSIDRQLVEDVKSVKEMFYAMPSPLEVAMILKQSNSPYNQEVLNPVKNTSRYVTTKSMALNLGIYTTDLSYSSLYDQTQTTIDYINAAKEMADGLGILNAIDKETVQRLEANVNNRDVILDIISETIMNSNSFFKENDQKAISTIVLIGGWIEGLYIATKLVEGNPSQQEINNNELINRIVDQKLALNTIESLVEEEKDNEHLASVNAQIKELKDVYDQIKINSSKVIPVKDSTTNVTTLKSQTSISMTPEIYKQLKEKIHVVRNKFTS